MTLLLMGIYAVVTFALAAYTWSHREQNFLIIKKPTPGLTRFLKLYASVIVLDGIPANIGGLLFPICANLVILVVGAFLAMIFVLISLTQMKL
ncbi:MAG: hypothetical protein ABF793_13290 [Lacticaseibacillus paracasei]